VPHLRIERRDVLSADAQQLIAELNKELSATYPEEGATHFRLDPSEVADGNGAFLVVYRDGAAVGCGAVRRLDATTAEVKRMYVRSGLRGEGLGAALLAAIEAEARRLGATRLLLETGVRQARALALYQHRGFERITVYGEYVGSPLSLCFAKELRTDEGAPQSEEEIDGVLRAWARAYSGADVSGLLALLTDDAEFWTHGAPPLVGRDAVRAVLEQFFERFSVVQRFVEFERFVAADWALLRGEESTTLTPKAGGERIEHRQRAFSLLRRGSDGRWRFARGMTNQGRAAD